MRSKPTTLTLGATLLFLLVVPGCATLRQMAALRHVDFSLDRMSAIHLAGIDLGQVRSFEDLGLSDAARLALAVTQKDLPLDFLLHVTAENPADNDTDARLVRMDWTLFLQDRETLSGALEEEYLLPPGEPQDIPVPVSLNLIEFFEGSAQDLLELALSLAGHGGAPKEVALRARPVINTPLGPIRYPSAITIVSETVGD